MYNIIIHNECDDHIQFYFEYCRTAFDPIFIFYRIFEIMMFVARLKFTASFVQCWINKLTKSSIGLQYWLVRRSNIGISVTAKFTKLWKNFFPYELRPFVFSSTKILSYREAVVEWTVVSQSNLVPMIEQSRKFYTWIVIAIQGQIHIFKST